MSDLRRQIVEESIRGLEVYGDGRHRRANQAAADRAMAGEIGFTHIGLEFIPVGRRSIDWSGGHRTHPEWRAQLNRFFFFGPLVVAYTETHREEYAEAARDYLADWLAANPRAADGTWAVRPHDNTLNLAIRLQDWMMALPAFSGSVSFDDALLCNAIESIAAQFAFLMNNIHAEGNWRIAHADALVMGGVMLAFDGRSRSWLETGVRIINEAFLRQVLADGVHIERNPGYHGWMTEVFERYCMMGRRKPSLGLKIDPRGVARMHDYWIASIRPNGTTNALHDCNGRAVARRAADWDARRRSFRAAAGLPDAMPATSQFFDVAGQACLRDSWAEDATYLVFDASTWGGTHCHLSRNALQLHAHGRTILTDPGTLTYEAGDPMMAHGKSTRAHNTISLNGWNQSTTNPESTRHWALPRYDVVDSRYVGGYWPAKYTWWIENGYGKGMWGEHYRLMVWIRGRAVVVVDLVNHTAGESDKPGLECNWQFTAAPKETEGSVVRVLADGAGVVSRYPEGNVLMLFPLKAPGARVEVFEGSREPLRGWLQGEKGYQAAPQVSVITDRLDAWATHLATVIVPFAGSAAPEVTARWVSVVSATGGKTVAAGDPQGYLELNWADGSRDRLDWTRRLETALGDRGEFRTDGALVHVCRASDGTERGLVMSGSFIEFASGKRVEGTASGLGEILF